MITSGKTPSRKLRRNSQLLLHELKRLVKISASLPHGQAFVESGFSTKKVVTGRNTLSLESVKAQKVVLSGIRAAGGAHLVSIFAKLLSSMKMAHSKKVAVAKEKAEAKRKAAAGEQAAKKRQEEQEAEQRNRDKKKLEDNIRELQEEIKNENTSFMAAVSKG